MLMIDIHALSDNPCFYHVARPGLLIQKLMCQINHVLHFVSQGMNEGEAQMGSDMEGSVGCVMVTGPVSE